MQRLYKFGNLLKSDQILATRQNIWNKGQNRHITVNTGKVKDGEVVIVDEQIEGYAERFTTPSSDTLKQIEKDTWVR